MTWNDKQPILEQLGHSNFETEEEYLEWFSELDRVEQAQIKKAMCNAEEYGLPTFNWSRNYFSTAKTINNATAKSY